MNSFAERMGFRQTRTLIQKDSLDDETRISLWNSLVFLKNKLRTHNTYAYQQDEVEPFLVGRTWVDFFKKPLDELPSQERVWIAIKKTILDGDWFESMDLVEFIATCLNEMNVHAAVTIYPQLLDHLNETFQQHMVGYRFIDGLITPIDTEAEIDAVESALEGTKTIAGARHSLDRAIELLADRKQPDYPNSIKESISAVEAIVKRVTGKGTLGEGLKKLEASGLKIHPALKDAWLKMYGWTSDADGIRHAGIEAADANQALAKYALVSSSAFISYLLDEGQKAGLLNNEDSPA